MYDNNLYKTPESELNPQDFQDDQEFISLVSLNLVPFSWRQWAYILFIGFTPIGSGKKNTMV